MKLADIHMRDPFVLPVPEERAYYLFGTTDVDCWAGSGLGFDCYRSRDLVEWEGPLPAFRPPSGFWGTRNFWAPEVHAYRGRYYLFSSFKAEHRYRGTQISVADAPAGPYQPLTAGPITPPAWECLDGTLFIEKDGRPWIVFCHEWVQVHNGAMAAMPLSEDLRESVGRPVFLFNAADAPWVKAIRGWPGQGDTYRFPCYVTDGPYLYRLANGVLLMLWSSMGASGYAMGIARSDSGTIQGPWRQDPEPLWAADGGHGMVFQTFDGRLYITFHSPNKSPNERPHFHQVRETDCTLVRI